jgi:hypothetical protein
MEVEAEAAANAMHEAPRRPHGCIRPIIWLMPTAVFYSMLLGAGYAFSAVFRGLPDSLELSIFAVLVIGATFGLGCFDGAFSPATYVASPSERQKRILLHGLFFTAHQVWLVPAISVLLVGACMAIASF